MMRRRAFLAAPLAAEAQQAGKMYRIGWLRLYSPPPGRPRIAFEEFGEFRQGMREPNWGEGKNIAFEVRFAQFKAESLPELAGYGEGTIHVHASRQMSWKRRE